MKLIFAALLVGLVAAQEPVVNSTVNVTPTEEALPRCRRPVCAKFCQFGQQTDTRGCPICQCLVDPCLEASCPMGQTCKAETECKGYPCTELPYTCEGSDVPPMPCPQVMCAEYCEFGLTKNEHGCDTCTCLKNPCNEVECLVEEQCKVVEDPKCPTGAYCSKVGKCVAAPSLRQPEEPLLPKCPLVQCALLCRFGFKKNEKGCNTCTCKTNPCDDVQCGEGEKCKHEPLEKCAHDICDLQTQCSVQPICEHIRQKDMDQIKMMYGMGGHKEGLANKHVRQCDERGNFMPRQCHLAAGECWCVNDLGEEIEGTRKAGKKPECPYNKTQAVKGHLRLQHNLGEDFDKHKEHLRPVLVAHLGKWMMIEEKHIQQVVITPDGENIQILNVDFVISGEIEDDIDLASSVHHLHLKVKSEETLIHYESFTLTPVPTSLETKHEFMSEPMAVPIDERNAFRSFYGAHKTAIVILIGLILMASIVVVMLVQVAKKRKIVKLHRSDNYQQNLAFTNEVYGKLAFLDDLAKDHTPDQTKDVEKNEATA